MPDSSFTSFLSYYPIVTNPAIGLANNSILAYNLRTRILPNMGLVVKYQPQYYFFRLFPGKTNEFFFQKVQKNTIFEPFWTFFSQVWVKMIFLEKRVSVFKSYNYLTSCKKSEKINELKTDWQTCNSDFIGPSMWRGSKKGNPLEKLSFFIDF